VTLDHGEARMKAGSKETLQWVAAGFALLSIGEAIALHHLVDTAPGRIQGVGQLVRFTDASNVVENWFQLTHAHGDITVSVDARTGRASCLVIASVPAGDRRFAG
jgi:hypothetical protein